ncbi:MAG: alpha/beta hydrolase [Sphingorhabdus sp.]
MTVMGILNRGFARQSAALAGLALVSAIPAHAASYLTVETTTYEWTQETAGGSAAPAAFNPVIASFGPFRVVSAERAELVGSIEGDTPALFAALLRAYPGIRQIDMIECPGTGDDEANLKLARMIRSAGIATHVPARGSVRSGGVELFLAGVRRSADPGAEFAVHSWLDEDGLQASDFAPSDPVHQAYLAFYREMGMDGAKARAFYALTNSVSFDDALYLKPRDIAAYIALN